MYFIPCFNFIFIPITLYMGHTFYMLNTYWIFLAKCVNFWTSRYSVSKHCVFILFGLESVCRTHSLINFIVFSQTSTPQASLHNFYIPANFSVCIRNWQLPYYTV